MNDKTKLSKEERILRAVKMVLTSVIKDTATPPGMRHPLSERTIEDLRQCLVLIASRERELAEAAGRPSKDRPYFVDDPTPRRKANVVVDIDGLMSEAKKRKQSDSKN